jgi:hypothetical protein
VALVSQVGAAKNKHRSEACRYKDKSCVVCKLICTLALEQLLQYPMVTSLGEEP